MIKNYVYIAIRYILKNKFINLINISGLALGIASSILIFQYVITESSYDNFWAESENIYRIGYEQYHNGTPQFNSTQSFRGLGMALKEELPEVVEQTSIGKDVITVYTHNEQIQDVEMYWTDTCFFKVFNRKFLSGDVNNPFPDIHSAVISAGLAKSLYGSTDVLGERFKLNEGWEFYISGIYEDIPGNSHFHPDMLINFPSVIYYLRNFDNSTNQLTNQNPRAGTLPALSSAMFWNLNQNHNPINYIKTIPSANPQVVESSISGAIEKYTTHFAERNVTCEYTLQPVQSIHLNSNLENEIGINGNKTMIVALTIIASIILLLGWINFINLSLAQALNRVKESGLRKVLGAKRKQLVQQFLTESFITNVLSAILSMLFVIILIQVLYKLTGNGFSFELNRQFFLYYLLIVLTGALVSGLIPALVISAIKPVQLFRKKVVNISKGFDLKHVLVVSQFAATIVLIICTIMVYKQINFMQNQALGVNIERTIISYSPMSMIKKNNLNSKLESFRSNVENIPEVESFSSSSSVPGKEIHMQNENVQLFNDEQNNQVSYSLINSDYNFFKTFSFNLVAGRLFRANTNPEENSIVINEKAAQLLGFANPAASINQKLQLENNDYTIIGVVKNHHHESLKKAVVPILYRNSNRWYKAVGYYSLKINSGNLKNTLAKIEGVWNDVYPNEKFVYRFLDDTYNAQYKSEILFGKIFGLFSILAIVIACLGLLGLSIFTSKYRIKEIGIRKVNGARIFEVLLLLNKNYAAWILFAFIIACPVAWLFMRNWLQNFAYRTEMSVWIFGLAGAVALLVALLTVNWQSWKAAKSNPVEALRYE